MRKILLLSAILSLPLFLGSAGRAVAEEGHEHKGSSQHAHMQGMEEMHKGMQGMESMSEGMQKMHAEHAATLREAAAVLKDSHPDLAAKLEAMVTMHEEMHEGMQS